jgi:hypothetical protein
VVAQDVRSVIKRIGRNAVANEIEVLGMRLLGAFDEEAIGDPRTAVLARDTARRAGFDYGSPDFDAALQHLLQRGYLLSHYIVGGEAYAITLEALEQLSKQ